MHGAADSPDPERARLIAARDHHSWRRWGPYLSDRQRGTVREDYSADGDAWRSFPHDHARSRAYRWGEDAILGVSDNFGRLCFGFAFWNGEDPILKERLFGLNNYEGNHGEDVKEYYWYLDNTPTHSYMRGRYKYPHRAFPYADLVAENARRTRGDPEYELADTGIFTGDAYFDIEIEYAKAGIDDIVIRLRATNRGVEPHALHVVPTLWFRNEWSWRAGTVKPTIAAGPGPVFAALHPTLDIMRLYAPPGGDIYFTENETNVERLYGVPNSTPYVKDGIGRAIVEGVRGVVNPALVGTKAALRYRFEIAPGETETLVLRLCATARDDALAAREVDATFAARMDDADRFYAGVFPAGSSAVARDVARQAFAGMLWCKQFYFYPVRDWLDGDPAMPPPPQARHRGRNADWEHFYGDSVLSMPDTWEYPWFAAWDLAFHVITLGLIDPEFAKNQLVLLTREWFMHPNGQLPAYEWEFDDVNPPVHAWAAYRLFQIERKRTGAGDYLFLERVFQKLLLNFTWWVNRKDAAGNNVFQGGFLGLDNIGLFDRDAQLPDGGHLNQADGTSWMGVYALDMLAIALELAQVNRVYEDIASKFFEHFLSIANAMNEMGGFEHGLWNDADGFYYDQLFLPDGTKLAVAVRSLVGVVPLFAIEPLAPETLGAVPDFVKRMQWFIDNRPDLHDNVAGMQTPGVAGRRLLAIADRDKLVRILARLFDENEFLSPFGIRSLSKHYAREPFELEIFGSRFSIDYEPAESAVGTFGGNSNWRGPIWFPLNYLIVESLQNYHYYLGDDFKVEFPTGSGTYVTLWDAASALSRRLIALFEPGPDGSRPSDRRNRAFATDPHWSSNVTFYEYYDGDDGSGLGASHQTGWTGIVAKLIVQSAEYGGVR